MKRRSILVLLVVLVPLLAGAGVWFGEPYLAMRALQSAIERNDRTELERLVDFESLRKEIRKELQGQLIRQRRSGNVLGALSSGMAMGNLGSTVDALLTPEGLSGLMRGRTLGAKLRPERDSLDDFIVWIKNDADGENGGREDGLVFRRQGRGWRLVSVKLAR